MLAPLLPPGSASVEFPYTPKPKKKMRSPASDAYIQCSCSINKAFLVISVVVAMLGVGLLGVTIFTGKALWRSPTFKREGGTAGAFATSSNRTAGSMLRRAFGGGDIGDESAQNDGAALGSDSVSLAVWLGLSSPSSSVTPTSTRSASESATASVTTSASGTVTGSASVSVSGTRTRKPKKVKVPKSPTSTSSVSGSASLTPSGSMTPSRSADPAITPSTTPSNTPSNSPPPPWWARWIEGAIGGLGSDSSSGDEPGTAEGPDLPPGEGDEDGDGDGDEATAAEDAVGGNTTAVVGTVLVEAETRAGIAPPDVENNRGDGNATGGIIALHGTAPDDDAPASATGGDDREDDELGEPAAAPAAAPASLASTPSPAETPAPTKGQGASPSSTRSITRSASQSRSGSKSNKPSKSERPSRSSTKSWSPTRTETRSVKPSKRPKPHGPFGGLVVNASDLSGSCTFSLCPNNATDSPWRDRPMMIQNRSQSASAMPYVYAIVNHRNRFANLNRLVQSIQDATSHDPVLQACMCIILVDYKSSVPAVQDDLRATCLPPWDSLLPVPGTLGADLYLDDAAQDAAWSNLTGTAISTDEESGKLLAPPGAAKLCGDSVHGMDTYAALRTLLGRYTGDSVILRGDGYFDSYSRAGLLSLGMASLRTWPHESLVFLVDADMLVRRGFFEEMLEYAVPGKQVFFPIVWSSCYGADASLFPTNRSWPSGKEARGWWRTTGTGMVVTYMKDMYKCGGYGADFVNRGEYGSEDWGLGECYRAAEHPFWLGAYQYYTGL